MIAKVGKHARGLKEGDRVTADINMSCGNCYYCIRGDQLLCNDFTQLGIHTDGTFAEYVKARASLVHHLPDNLSFEDGAFIELAGRSIEPVVAGDDAPRVVWGLWRGAGRSGRLEVESYCRE